MPDGGKIALLSGDFSSLGKDNEICPTLAGLKQTKQTKARLLRTVIAKKSRDGSGINFSFISVLQRQLQTTAPMTGGLLITLAGHYGRSSKALVSSVPRALELKPASRPPICSGPKWVEMHENQISCCSGHEP